MAFTDAPLSTVRSSPAVRVTELPVEKMVTPLFTIRKSSVLLVSSPEFSVIESVLMMSASTLSGLDVRTLILPAA